MVEFHWQIEVLLNFTLDLRHRFSLQKQVMLSQNCRKREGSVIIPTVILHYILYIKSFLQDSHVKIEQLRNAIDVILLL